MSPSILFTVTNRTISVPPLQYQDVVNSPPRKPYVTSNPISPTPYTGRRKRRQITNTRTSFTIGIENPCESDDEICNGPLDPLTTYRYMINLLDTTKHYKVKCESNQKSMFIQWVQK